jgi:hypothetical protein
MINSAQRPSRGATPAPPLAWPYAAGSSSSASIMARSSSAAAWMRARVVAPGLVGDRAVGGQHLREPGDDRQRRPQVVAQLPELGLGHVPSGPVM